MHNHQKQYVGYSLLACNSDRLIKTTTEEQLRCHMSQDGARSRSLEIGHFVRKRTETSASFV